MAFYFLNVDFELRTLKKPTAFVRALHRYEASLLRSAEIGDEWWTTFEMPGCSHSHIRILSEVKKLFASLTPRARAEWDGAKERILDFGYELTGADRIQEIDLHPRFLAFAVQVKASVRITVYDENHSSLKSRPS